ncbi:MAG: TlpA disulfide reductase family protein [Steroidobacteraceae bacterium]
MFPRPTLLRRAGFAGLCGFMLAMSQAPAEPAADGAPVAVGHALPDVLMAGLNGPARRLSSYRGRPLIINVWASWCGPCRAETASLERLAWGEAGGHFVVIGISTDDYRNEALRWLQNSNATLDQYIDSRQVLENLLGASRIPLTVLVDARGRVVARFQGARDWDTEDSVRLIQRAFASARAPAPRR